MNKNYVLETYALSKKYKDRFAVKDVNMHVEEGDIYGFVGENGAGKTTIIRLVLGLANASSGRYALFGVNSANKEISLKRKMVSGIVESVTISRSLTAIDNLKVECLVTDTKKTDEELIALLEKVGLNYEEIKNKKAGDFSLGMRQRLGLATCLVSNPRLILLDEPMNGLDPQGFVDVREIIMKLNQEGVTFLISSHILSELDKICNRIGIISHGKLLEEITIDELHKKSRKRLVIEASDVNALKELIMSNMDLQEVEIEDNSLVIYDNVDINKIMAILVNNKFTIDKIGLQEDTIEDYYINALKRG